MRQYSGWEEEVEEEEACVTYGHKLNLTEILLEDGWLSAWLGTTKT